MGDLRLLKKYRWYAAAGESGICVSDRAPISARSELGVYLDGVHQCDCGAPLLTAAMLVVLDTVAPCAIVPVAMVLAIVISLTVAFVVAAVPCRDHAGGG